MDGRQVALGAIEKEERRKMIFERNLSHARRRSSLMTLTLTFGTDTRLDVPGCSST